jgi:hypothetical protein
MSLFPEDRNVPVQALESVQVKLSEMELHNAGAFGDRWLGCDLWRQLRLDEFWSERLGQDREAVPWSFDVLLYDLTSPYLEGEAEQIPNAKRGYSRDGRLDCVQLVIALVVTTDGFPLAYEVMDGHTSNKTTFKGFLTKIESMSGKAQGVWVMDRGIPTEAVLREMREADQPVHYLVGTPRAKMRKMEQQWLELPWRKVRDLVAVKLAAEGGEMYVLAKSEGRQAKEMAMRRKKLARLLWKLRAMRRAGRFALSKSRCRRRSRK